MNTLYIDGNPFGIWDEIRKTAMSSTLAARTSLPSCLVSGNFPPADIICDKDENITIKMALAGYDQSMIDIEFNEENYLVIKSIDKDDEVKADEDEIYYIQKGIKSGSFNKKFFVDTRYLDKNTVSASMKDGMLTIKIPRKEKDPNSKIKIQ